jgi:hypothetical protein
MLTASTPRLASPPASPSTAAAAAASRPPPPATPRAPRCPRQSGRRLSRARRPSASRGPDSPAQRSQSASRQPASAPLDCYNGLKLVACESMSSWAHVSRDKRPAAPAGAALSGCQHSNSPPAFFLCNFSAGTPSVLCILQLFEGPLIPAHRLASCPPLCGAFETPAQICYCLYLLPLFWRACHLVMQHSSNSRTHLQQGRKGRASRSMRSGKAQHRDSLS